jgi:signal transduction histidine kinase
MPGLTTAQALALLDKLRAAAPPATGGRLAEVAALIESLAQEKAYLNALVTENTSLLAGAPADPLPPDAAPEPPPGGLAPLELLAAAGDALRAPLSSIQDYVRLAQAEASAGLDDEAGGWLGTVSRHTERALRLLDTLAQITALEQGRVPFDHANFVTSDLLEEAQRRSARVIAARRHRLTPVVPQSVPLASGDYYQTLIVLLDLLDNAARYTPEGGMIRLSVDSLGTHVLFSVADNGIGLSAEDMVNVGRPFWRGDQHPLVRLHSDSATGLRLFLAKQILARQAGELIFSGEPGMGSTFSFTLPSPG